MFSTRATNCRTCVVPDGRKKIFLEQFFISVEASSESGLGICIWPIGYAGSSGPRDFHAYDLGFHTTGASSSVISPQFFQYASALSRGFAQCHSAG